MSPKSKTGFTLIEILVVIAIVAILAAILFPVFAQAKGAAKKAVCLSNLKQLSLAGTLYSEDHDERFLEYWPAVMNGYLWNGAWLPYSKSRAIHLCPATRTTANSLYIGSAADPYEQEVRFPGSYTYNGWTYCNPPYGVCAMGEVAEPSSLAWLSDGMWVDAWIENGDANCPRSFDTSRGTTNGAQIGRVCVDRHNGGIDLTYLDTHAKYAKLGALSKIAFKPN